MTTKETTDSNETSGSNEVSIKSLRVTLNDPVLIRAFENYKYSSETREGDILRDSLIEYLTQNGFLR